MRIVIHEVWGGFDDGAVAELDSLARMAKALGDGTDYAAPPGSNAPGAFAVHWARDLGITLHTSIGELLVKSAGIVNSEGAAERAHAIAASGVGTVGNVRGGHARQVDRGEGHTDRLRTGGSCGGRRGCRYATAVRTRVQ